MRTKIVNAYQFVFSRIPTRESLIEVALSWMASILEIQLSIFLLLQLLISSVLTLLLIGWGGSGIAKNWEFYMAGCWVDSLSDSILNLTLFWRRSGDAMPGSERRGTSDDFLIIKIIQLIYERSSTKYRNRNEARIIKQNKQIIFSFLKRCQVYKNTLLLILNANSRINSCSIEMLNQYFSNNQSNTLNPVFSTTSLIFIYLLTFNPVKLVFLLRTYNLSIKQILFTLLLLLYNILPKYLNILISCINYFSSNHMDEQQRMFYLDEFNEEVDANDRQSYSVQSPVYQPLANTSFTLKALNPYQLSERLPEKEKQLYLHMIEHNKTYAGLTHFINFEKSEHIPQFLSLMRSEDYNQDWIEKPLHLDHLFDSGEPGQIKKTIQQIEEQIKNINNKAFTQINISHTLMPNFCENFDNFKYLNSHLNFLKDLEVKMLEFVQGVSTKKVLLVEIYNFWMNAFVQFVLKIKAHTERYTLKFVKQSKENGSNSNQQGKSTSSSRVNEMEKRKPWKPSQLQMLNRVINSNSAFNQSTINKLSEELNRTPASISSKIQKIIKDHRVHNPDYQVHQNMTLLQKIINVLKNYPQGLSRESVIERVSEHYQMGYDMTWSKSVAQILSSRQQFVKIKGTYSLNGSHKLDLSKKTFKDKVINCLLTIPGGKADLKKLVEQYVSLYGTTQGISILSQQRRKSIESSISKSLCRYDIFNKDSSKTVYKLREFCDERTIEQQIDGFIS